MLFRSDRKSTRLNSSHTLISYAVFCLKKKKTNTTPKTTDIDQPSATQPRSATHTYQTLTLKPGGWSACIFLDFFSLYFFFFFLINGAPPNSPLFPSPPSSL